MCVDVSSAHLFITNLTVTSAVVLNGPVLCSWMLLANVMWPFKVLLTVKIRVAFCLTLNNNRLTTCRYTFSFANHLHENSHFMSKRGISYI